MMNPEPKEGEEKVDLNCWHFITVGPKKGGYDREDMELICEHALTVWETRAERAIKERGFGAIDTDDPDAPDGVYLVCWATKPYPLQEDTVVEGCVEPLERGTLVARAKYLYPVQRARGWYEKDNHDHSPTKVFWLRHVLDPDLQLQKWKEGENEPPAQANRYFRRILAFAFMFRLTEETREMLQMTKEARKKMDMVELHLGDPDPDIEQEDDEVVEEEEEEENDN
jgi:hypothetical protein